MMVKDLMEQLASRDEADRTYAVYDLSGSHDPAVLITLFNQLSGEKSRTVREAIFTTLETIDLPEVIERAADLLESDDAFLRNHAVTLLQKKGTKSIAVLLNKMKSSSEDVRKFVLDTAAAIPDSSIDRLFAQGLEDKDINVVIATLEYIAKLKKRQFKERVENILQLGSNAMLIAAALTALVSIGDESSWRVILERYITSNRRVSVYEGGMCIQAIGEWGRLADLPLYGVVAQKCGGDVVMDLVTSLERYQERNGACELPGDLLDILASCVTKNEAGALSYRALYLLGGFKRTLGVEATLIAFLGNRDVIIRRGAIEGLKCFNDPSLNLKIEEQLMTNRECDPDVLSALKETLPVNHRSSRTR